MSDYELTYNDYDSREKILPERDKAYTPVMEAIGLSIEFGGLPPSTTSTSPSAAPRSAALSARTARARRPSSTC